MTTEKNSPTTTILIADRKTLLRTFIRPENDAARATLVKYMEQILFGLHDFLKKHVGITEEISLKKLSSSFEDTSINKNPEKKLTNVITDLVTDIAPYAVNVASPYFVGHMTSAIPFFMVHLKTIVAALNQNVVKLETSKVVSVVEKQVLAKIHRLIYQESESFYQEHVQSTSTSLGCFVEGGTTANLTALWVARNSAFAAKKGFGGVEKEGIPAAYKAYEVERSVIFVSRLAHYSLRKAGGILGIGNQNIIPIDVDKNSRVDIDCLNKAIKKVKKQGKTKIIAIIGIVGATETGTVDPLRKIGEIAAENQVHFHADAAFGGPTLMSEKYKHLLDGIELADSVTIDGHKQFYMPMTCGMVYFKNPTILNNVEYHANYVARQSSVDLGMKTLSGSREANSLILDSALKIMGSKGYALLIEHGIETAKELAKEIEKRESFQLMTPPELNLLTYRICPPSMRQQLSDGNSDEIKSVNQKLNTINRAIQMLQREAGNSFVSRTLMMINNNPENEIVVLRCVVMNPLTDMRILNKILDEQEEIFKSRFAYKST
jgi:glutamate decarboxylase